MDTLGNWCSVGGGEEQVGKELVPIVATKRVCFPSLAYFRVCSKLAGVLGQPILILFSYPVGISFASGIDYDHCRMK